MRKIKTPSSRITNALVNAAVKAQLTPTALCAVRNWLAEQLLGQEYAKLGQGGHTQNQVPLRRVFVDLPVTDSLSALSQHESRILFLNKLLSSDPLILCDIYKPRGTGNSSASNISEDEDDLDERKHASGDRRRRDPGFGAILLIGGPGQGKSTLGQLVCQLHRAALLKPLEDELTSSQRDLVHSFEVDSSKQNHLRQPLSLPQKPFLPLQIALPEFAAWLAKEQTNQASASAPALLRFLADLPSAKTYDLSADNLLELASHMPSLLVLDGFDEVGATKDRERLVAAARDLLSVLAKRNAVAQIVATTRPQGYAGELDKIGLPLQPYYLAPLLREEALEYAQKLVEAKIPGTDQRTKALDRLHEAAAEPATERLLTTPLQVTILTALVQQLGRAPRERWNLFSRYFAYTYDREIERGTYASRLLAEHRAHIEQIHARVALLLQVEAERDGGASARMPRERLEEVIEAVLSEDEVSEIERKDLVKEIAVAAEQRLVFLVEPEPGSFGFEIRSLQEFMAAWALTSGRDTEIEARLQQVAKAPMFRNVALFVTSRLFSEGSPLRDVLADQVCGSLDDDPDDELAHLTRAGGMLALETLEEGAVLSQPKRARSLMARATGLFSLPPGSEHARIARAVNSDTAQVLRDAIEKCIGGHQYKRQCSTQAAWICLVEATNRRESWAMELGDNFWQHLSDPLLLLNACARLDIPLGQWIAAKIESDAESFPPENFVNMVTFSPEPGVSQNWVSWLVAVCNVEIRLNRTHQFTYFLPLLASGSLAELVAPLDSTAPVSWHGWVFAALFEIKPNASHLARALKVIADTLPLSRWKAMQWRFSWPLASCLGAADTPEDLRRFAEMLISGDLGDEEEWRKAEASWDDEEIDLLTILDDMAKDTPWSRESLKHSPPPFVVPVWMFSEQLSGRRTAARSAAILEKANRVFQASRSRTVRQRLAEVCFRFLRTLSAKAPRNNINPAEWLAELPNRAELLVPRPKFIRRAEWLELLDASAMPAQPLSYIGLDEGFNSLVDSGGHPVVIRLAVLSLGMCSRHMARQVQSMLSNIKSTNKTIDSLLDSLHLPMRSAAAVADLAILRIFQGTIPAECDADLFHDIAVAAVDDQSLWTHFLGALRFSRLPQPRLSVLLAKTFLKMGTTHPQANTAIQQLRYILQTRKSDLDHHAMWNRLALPLPYPQQPLLPRLDGGIPLLPIKVETLELRDVGVLHHLKLPLKVPSEDKGQWVVILGPNGIGKTTLLRSLALALRSVKDPAIWPKGAFSNSWQRVSANNKALATESRITIRLGDGVEHSTLIRPNGTISFSQLPEQDYPRLFPLFAYGCRRGSALGGAARQVDLADDDGPEIATLFDEGAALIHAETWLLQLEGDAPKSPRSRAIFDAVIGAIKALLDLDAMEVSDRKVWVTERGRPRLPFSALSDGYLTSAGWFLDLVARWITLAEHHNVTIEADFLAGMRGLVLIDEIDLHLHPRGQIEIITRTRRLLPQMSFVVTTHNPLTLVGAKAEEIWVLSSEDGRIKATCGEEAPMLLTGGQIYHRYFGIDDIYPDGLGRSLQRFSFLSGYALRNDAEQSELECLQKQLSLAGLDPGWDVVERTKGQSELSMITKPKKSASRRCKGVE